MTNNPTLISGTLNNSRKEANFLSYYMRNNPIGRMEYLKQTVARDHKDLLLPFIEITHTDRYAREIQYKIKADGINPEYTGTTYQSRSKSDYMNKKPKSVQHTSFKKSIADSHSNRLVPFVQIVTASKDFRTVDYTITLP